jgi:MFS family permease
MAVIAWSMVDDRDVAPREESPRGGFIEWRVVALSAPLFLYSYSYGTVSSFSAVYADARGLHPKTVYLTTFAIVTLLTRPFFGRYGDRIGYRRIFMPSLVVMTFGMVALTLSDTRLGLALSAALFAIGFGTAYPAFAAYVMQGVSHERRGAAFGAILAAFDTGIGAGSTTSGWLIGRYDFRTAFGLAAALAALALPAFILTERRFGHAPEPPPSAAEARGPDLEPLAEE